MLVGVGGNSSFGTQLSLIFIKRDKIIKYIVVDSADKCLRDVAFLYRRKQADLFFPRAMKNANYKRDIPTKSTPMQPWGVAPQAFVPRLGNAPSTTRK
ncbi:MAG: hypothetical protein ACK5IQ_03230 [Bacteroidales bacterium]